MLVSDKPLHTIPTGVEETWLEKRTTVSHYLLSVITRRDAGVWEDQTDVGRKDYF
jgi:hypothetical protein